MGDINFEADVTIRNLVTAEECGLVGNDPEKVEEFRDLGFGLFIHWSLDCVLGTVISHWMCGADYKLIEQFIKETPDEFNPKYFDADDIAALAKQAGMKYFVFTTKHHNGFCMFDTKTTSFQIMNTPFKRDVTRELLQAFREKKLWTGLYFSPWDLLYTYQHGIPMHLASEKTLPENQPELMKYNQTQLLELLHNYGDIDMFFFDGPPEGLKPLVWREQERCLVTRGEMLTPENNLEGITMQGAWEANYTLGNTWGYRPYGDSLRTPEIVELLIKIRAQGGNFLLNVSPDPLGRIPDEQVRVLREVGLFTFFNQEALYKVRPWKVTHEEGDIWYTKKKDENVVYAFLLKGVWDVGFDHKKREALWHDVTLKSVRGKDDTKVEIVGQSGLLMEHVSESELNPQASWRQDEEGMHIHCIVCFRGHDDRTWDFPLVIRITNPV